MRASLVGKKQNCDLSKPQMCASRLLKVRAPLRGARTFNNHNVYILGFWRRGPKGGEEDDGLDCAAARCLAWSIPTSLSTHGHLAPPIQGPPHVPAAHFIHIYHLNTWKGKGVAGRPVRTSCGARSSCFGVQMAECREWATCRLLPTPVWAPGTVSVTAWHRKSLLCMPY